MFDRAREFALTVYSCHRLILFLSLQFVICVWTSCMIKASLNYYRACNCTLLVLSRKAFLRKESLFELIQSVRSLFDRTVNSVARIAVSYMAYLY